MSIVMTAMRTAALPAALLLAVALVARANEAQRSERVAAPHSAVLACLDTGAVDALTLHSDHTVFMRKDCPESVRQGALRRLWRLLPSPETPEHGAI